MSLKQIFDFKKRRLILYIIIAIVVVVILCAVAFIGNKRLDSNSANNTVKTYKVPERSKIFINGSLVPKQSKEFNLPANNSLQNVNVKNGDKVKKGDLLYTSEDKSIVSQIDNLKRQLRQLQQQKNNLDNTKPFNIPGVNNQSSSKPDTSNINSQIDDINSNISDLNNRAYDKVTAPFDGKVYLNEDNQGDQSSLGQGAPFMTLQSKDLYMNGLASEQDLLKLSIDQVVDVNVFSTDQKLTGRISAISDMPNTPNLTSGQQQNNSTSFYDVSIQLDSQDKLVNGFHLQATTLDRSSDVKIPSSSILKDKDNNTYVLKDVGGVVKKYIISISRQNEDYATVSSGVDENDLIIKFPTKKLKNGDKIKNSNDNTLTGKNKKGKTK